MRQARYKCRSVSICWCKTRMTAIPSPVLTKKTKCLPSVLTRLGWKKSSGRQEQTLMPVPMRVATVPLRTDGASLQDGARENPVRVKKKKQGVGLVGRKSHPEDRPVRPNQSAHQAHHSGTSTCRPWGSNPGRSIAPKRSGRRIAGGPRRPTRMREGMRRSLWL